MISKEDVIWLAMDDLEETLNVGEDPTNEDIEGWIRNNMSVLRDSAYEDLERQGIDEDDITDEDINRLVDEWMEKNLNSRQECDHER